MTHRFSVRSNRAHLVDWHEWGQEAFDLAVAQDKPVVLFLTAFWCGFCQRMDESTLSNDEVIALLNAYFVPIRVEESQRPDVDLRYNQDGWPTIAFMTPQGDHLFSVNHLAPEPFLDLLAKTVRMFTEDRATIETSVTEARSDVEQRLQAAHAESRLDARIVDEIVGIVEGLADHARGGYDDPTQNKFLHAEANDFFLYLHGLTGEASYLDHVVQTLEKMRKSRTYDEIDGGYYRYSTKPDWREPHPEKLLADQGAVLGNYLQTYLLTESETARSTAEALIDYLLTTLSDASTGAFLGCQDYVRPEGGALREPPAQGRRQLLSIVDEYIYTDQNAQVISSLLQAWWILGRADARDRAVTALDFLWSRLRGPNGGMFHLFAEGRPGVPGIVMDSAYTGKALLDAYAILGDPRYLDRAKDLAEELVREFRNPDGGFWDVSETGPAGMAKPMTVLTQNAVIASFFVKLADLTEDVGYRRQAHWALRDFPNVHRSYNAFAAGFGEALSRLLAPSLILKLTGVAGAGDVRALARAGLTDLHHPDLVLVFEFSGRADPAYVTPRLDGRDGHPIEDPSGLTVGAMTGGS